MEGARREMMINGGVSSGSGRATYGRPIPRRGQVKAAIVVGVANSLASFFSSKNGSSQLSH
ncbi:Actin cytoskeleton-regulatory complex protein [Actinidia chinensis var. chinensis]|uniref:Uncharacterized protein n=2 Tax=Actinidia TaxID=3624 RepID=A0A7J0G648_9ERIC|nr:Actin cytoskeleton-regulatory complex protein [Actinidia chinensis var. chinensis]GFZ06247.1 hypothetical protein Acr_18g0004170 [Actinidia rufa]